MTLFDTILAGGILWPRQNPRSPGHSIAIPSGTAFKVRIDGPTSHRFEAGVVEGNELVMREGRHAGERFPSANAAVDAVREDRTVSSNAFLYVLFEVSGRWVEADDMRRQEAFKVDPVEEKAFALAVEKIRELLKQKRKTLTELEIVRKAAEAAPKFMELAKLHTDWTDVTLKDGI